MSQTMTQEEFESRWKTKGSKTKAHFDKYPYLADSYYEFQERSTFYFDEVMMEEIKKARARIKRERTSNVMKLNIYEQHIRQGFKQYGVITMSQYDIHEHLLWLAEYKEVGLPEARIIFEAAKRVGPFVNGREV